MRAHARVCVCVVHCSQKWEDWHRERDREGLDGDRVGDVNRDGDGDGHWGGDSNAE